MTLGELIAQLEAWPPDANVAFDFCGLRPTSVRSYRGYYDQLALGFGEEPGTITNAELLANLRAALRHTFTGWKGGEYRMSATTKMWASNPGHCNATALSGVAVDDYRGGGNREDDGTCVYIRLLTSHES